MALREQMNEFSQELSMIDMARIQHSTIIKATIPGRNLIRRANITHNTSKWNITTLNIVIRNRKVMPLRGAIIPARGTN